MRLLAGLALSAASLTGGVVGGIVLEQLSGIPLARSRVRLDRVDSTGRVRSQTISAGRSGQFTFTGLPDGLYVLAGSRDGYAPIAYGQRRPPGAGPIFAVLRDTNLFAELRLRKLDDEIDEEILAAANAPAITLRASATAVADLTRTWPSRVRAPPNPRKLLLPLLG